MAEELTPEQKKFQDNVEKTEASLRKEILENKSPTRSRESKRVVPPARLIPANQQFDTAPPVVITEEMVETNVKPSSDKVSQISSERKE